MNTGFSPMEVRRLKGKNAQNLWIPRKAVFLYMLSTPQKSEKTKYLADRHCLSLWTVRFGPESAQFDRYGHGLRLD